MKSTMKLKRLQYADKVSGTLKGSMFFLRSTQNLQKVFLSALALHRKKPVCMMKKVMELVRTSENSKSDNSEKHPELVQMISFF